MENGFSLDIFNLVTTNLNIYFFLGSVSGSFNEANRNITRLDELLPGSPSRNKSRRRPTKHLTNEQSTLMK